MGWVFEEAREARGGAGDYLYSELCGTLLPQRTGKEPLDLLRLKPFSERAHLMGD